VEEPDGSGVSESARLEEFSHHIKKLSGACPPTEHEYQKEQLGQIVRDSFGNLALHSPGENSSYSNQAPEKRRVDFERKPSYDALKLAHIFHLMGKGNWDAAKIKHHQQSMLELLLNHYKAL
jgi:hypothetical protein